jgi:hypothetical protein
MELARGYAACGKQACGHTVMGLLLLFVQNARAAYKNCHLFCFPARFLYFCILIKMQ